MLALLGVPSLMERNGEDRAYSPQNWQLATPSSSHGEYKAFHVVG